MARAIGLAIIWALAIMAADIRELGTCIFNSYLILDQMPDSHFLCFDKQGKILLNNLIPRNNIVCAEKVDKIPVEDCPMEYK